MRYRSSLGGEGRERDRDGDRDGGSSSKSSRDRESNGRESSRSKESSGGGGRYECVFFGQNMHKIRFIGLGCTLLRLLDVGSPYG